MKNVLNDLFWQMTEPSDSSMGSASSAEVMAKIIAAVCTVSSFSLVCRNLQENRQELLQVLRSCALTADRQALKAYGESQSSFASNHVLSSLTDTTADLFKSSLIDRNQQRDHTEDQNRRRFKEYGDTRKATQSSTDIQGLTEIS